MARKQETKQHQYVHKIEFSYNNVYQRSLPFRPGSSLLFCCTAAVADMLPLLHTNYQVRQHRGS